MSFIIISKHMFSISMQDQVSYSKYGLAVVNISFSRTQKDIHTSRKDDLFKIAKCYSHKSAIACI